LVQRAALFHFFFRFLFRQGEGLFRAALRRRFAAVRNSLLRMCGSWICLIHLDAPLSRRGYNLLR
jgi:hypothetical protein